MNDRHLWPDGGSNSWRWKPICIHHDGWPARAVWEVRESVMSRWLHLLMVLFLGGEGLALHPSAASSLHHVSHHESIGFQVSYEDQDCGHDPTSAAEDCGSCHTCHNSLGTYTYELLQQLAHSSLEHRYESIPPRDGYEHGLLRPPIS